jgi:hypothetical protein
MLEKAPPLEPQTLLLHLEQTFPGQEWYRSKRTLQRRVEQWKALHGAAREVMFLQHHQPGVLGISDFTVFKGEPITICGEVLEHRLFHFRLAYSGLCHVEVEGGSLWRRELCRPSRGAAERSGPLWWSAGRAPHRQPQLVLPRPRRQLRRRLHQPLQRAVRPLGCDRHPQQPRRGPMKTVPLGDRTGTGNTGWSSS